MPSPLFIPAFFLRSFVVKDVTSKTAKPQVPLQLLAQPQPLVLGKVF